MSNPQYCGLLFFLEMGFGRRGSLIITTGDRET